VGSLFNMSGLSRFTGQRLEAVNALLFFVVFLAFLRNKNFLSFFRVRFFQKIVLFSFVVCFVIFKNLSHNIFYNFKEFTLFK